MNALYQPSASDAQAADDLAELIARCYAERLEARQLDAESIVAEDMDRFFMGREPAVPRTTLLALLDIARQHGLDR